MKLPVTQRIVEQVLREAHEAKTLKRAGLFAGETLGGGFCGCAVGNLLNAAAGLPNDPDLIQSAAVKIAGDDEYAAYFFSVADGDNTARREAREGRYLSAISAIFESRYERGGIDSVIAGIRDFLPARFSIDIDGLRALPTWRKRKPAKSKPRRKGSRK